MASKPSEVSIPKASYHYFTSMQNLLFTAGTICFLGKHIVRYLGKDVADFPLLGKISENASAYFAFYDLGSAAKSIYSTYSVLYLGSVAKSISSNYSALSGDSFLTLRGSHPVELYIQSKGDSPHPSHTYIGVKIWMTYKTVSSLFKTVSSLLLVHEALKRIGSVKTSFSPTIRAIGAGLGLAGFVIDSIDQRFISYDMYDENNLLDEEDNHYFYIPSYLPYVQKIKLPKNTNDITLYREMSKGARRYGQLVLVLLMGIKFMGVIHALDMVDYSGLIGRVSQFAIDNANDCYGFLYTAMTLTGLIQHIFYGATIQQLEQRNVNK